VQRPFFGDPDLGRLGETLNALLDMVDRQQHELEEQLKQVQALSSAVIRAQEEERRRIALELHDEASQALTAIIVGHRVLDQLEDIEEVRRHSQRLRELTAATLDDLHRLIVELRPSLLEERGLGPAVRWHANEFSERFNIPVEVTIEGLRGRLPAEVETVLFRIVQEALTNVARHAQARHARVRIERTARGLDATIEDDGRGFSVERVHAKKEALPGLGLVGMHERAASLNGWCTVTSTVGQGTMVCVHIPEECLVAPEHGNGQDQHIEEYSRGEDTYSHR
jgi:signal transduction histidine kinase